MANQTQLLERAEKLLDRTEKGTVEYVRQKAVVDAIKETLPETDPKKKGK